MMDIILGISVVILAIALLVTRYQMKAVAGYSDHQIEKLEVMLKNWSAKHDKN